MFMLPYVFYKPKFIVTKVDDEGIYIEYNSLETFHEAYDYLRNLEKDVNSMWYILQVITKVVVLDSNYKSSQEHTIT